MREIGARPLVPNHKWAHLTPIFSKILKWSYIAIDLQDASHGLWQPPEATSLLPEAFPLKTIQAFLPIMDPRFQEPGMGHKWYHIPLCTISPQNSNGDTLKTPFPHFTSHEYSIIPF
ncbi:hypothetical protein O181_056562 [Austropuccinia psidii MF-1]|uniref:Uncharacterized protein n=1 Tax=Austropuccinia psidii MF-1 TaxID=1389203 RepID=A0A9Q3EB08_9BASI|nr:hypothetical protein [Austropuccinia psidii MF-1]